MSHISQIAKMTVEGLQALSYQMAFFEPMNPNITLLKLGNDDVDEHINF